MIALLEEQINPSLASHGGSARLVAVEDSGHLPQWEQPAIVNTAIVEFLHDMK